MSSIRIKHNYGEIRHYHGEIRPLVGGMSMGLKKAFRKRDYGFGDEQPDGYRYDYF